MCKILEEMREENLKEGIQQGIQIGEERGIDKGKQEIAMRMLKTGRFPLAEIAELSGFPIGELEKLLASENVHII